MLRPTKKIKPKPVAAEEEGEAEEELMAMKGGRPVRHQPAISNEAALQLKLQQLTNGADPEDDDKAWLDCLVVTAPEPLGVEDAEDDLKRELAFYNQALSAVKVAQGRMDRLGIPYRRPDDYFAEMTKSDKHMERVKRKIIGEQESIKAADERRKQRTAKKFGKAVQVAKMQERAQQKKRSIAEVTNARKKGIKLDNKFDGFDIGIDEPASKRHASGSAVVSKRERADQRFGKKQRKDKRNSAESSGDMSYFNGRRGGKGGGKGKGAGGRGGEGRGRAGGRGRPGKEARRKARA